MGATPSAEMSSVHFQWTTRLYILEDRTLCSKPFWDVAYAPQKLCEVINHSVPNSIYYIFQLCYIES
jgi:hypothetical protein